jgi:D-alanyl-D-alanine carboxypeptidase (penicillin-binding protein 5/6)
LSDCRRLRRPIAYVIVVALFIGFLLIPPGLVAPVRAQVEFDIKAPAGVLVDNATGQILWAKNADQRKAPASITKIMTMLLIMEALDAGRISTKDVVTASRRAASFGGSNIFLKEGERMTVDEMLKAIAIFSANDASVAMAEYLAGSVEGFVDAMNKRAKQLGMNATYFQNPEGLPAPVGAQGNYSTPSDIAIMARELLKHPRILHYSSMKSSTLRGGKFRLDNTNHLIGRFPGADGLKTGHTEEAGWSLVGTAKRGDLRLISVVLDTDSDDARVTQSALLLDYGFRSYQRIPLVKKGAEVARFNVPGGGRDVIALAGEDLRALVRRGEKPEVRMEFERRPGLKAPVNQGDEVGRAVAVVGGKRVGSVPAVAKETVKKANFVIVFLRWLYQGIIHIITFGRK